jgi:hypothetical protein
MTTGDVLENICIVACAMYLCLEIVVFLLLVNDHCYKDWSLPVMQEHFMRTFRPRVEPMSSPSALDVQEPCKLVLDWWANDSP